MKPLARRLLLSLVTLFLRVSYRLRPARLHHIPQEGGALLVANHVTFIDALVLASLCPRPVRFVMDHRFFSHPIIGPISRLYRAIPIAPRREDPARLSTAMDTIDQTLAQGELVVIFPEGRLTLDGQLGPFKRGVEQILARRPVPVVPLAFRGLWGSIFSRAKGRFGQIRRPVDLICGPALSPQTPADALRAQVAELRGAHL